MKEMYEESSFKSIINHELNLFLSNRKRYSKYPFYIKLLTIIFLVEGGRSKGGEQNSKSQLKEEGPKSEGDSDDMEISNDQPVESEVSPIVTEGIIIFISSKCSLIYPITNHLMLSTTAPALEDTSNQVLHSDPPEKISKTVCEVDYGDSEPEQDGCKSHSDESESESENEEQHEDEPGEGTETTGDIEHSNAQPTPIDDDQQEKQVDQVTSSEDKTNRYTKGYKLSPDLQELIDNHIRSRRSRDSGNETVESESGPSKNGRESDDDIRVSINFFRAN